MITVNAPVNQAPVAIPQTLDIDVSLTSITLSGNDPDGDNANLTYEIVNQPTSGSLIINNNFVTYSPNSFPPVNDSFTFRVIDEKGVSSSPATITLVANKPPVIIELTPPITVTAGDSVTLNGLGTDPEDGSNVTYAWSSNTNPPITGNSSSLTFTAVNNTNQSITVTFTLQVFDTKGLGSEPGMVNVTINPQSQNQNPVVFSKEVVQEGGNPLTIDLSLSEFSNDPDGDPLTFEILSVNAPDFTLDTTNLPLVVASDPADIPISGTFTFQATDPGGLVSNTGTITVRFVPIPNLPPVANAGIDTTWYISSTDPMINVSLDGSASFDPEGSALTYKWSTTSGITLFDDTVVKPAFDIGAPGVFTFSLIVKDDLGQPSNTSSVTVSVIANDAPVANTLTLDMNQDTTLSVPLGGTDFDGDTVTVVDASISAPANGVVVKTGSGIYTYQPNPGFHGEDTFTYKVSDGKEQSFIATVTIKVNAKPTAIIKQGSSGTAVINKPFDLSGTASFDPDPGETSTLTYQWTLISSPAGSTTLFGPGTQNDPVTAFRADTPGDYVVSLIVTDINGLASNPAKITITIPNQAPIANPLVVTGFSTAEIFTVTGSDPDGNLPLTFEIETGSVVDGQVTFDFTQLPTVTATPLGLPVKGSFKFFVIDSLGKRSVNPATVEVTFN